MKLREQEAPSNRKEEEKLRLILTEKETSPQVIVKLWTEVFPTIVIWSDEDIEQQLVEVYDFNEKETNILLDKYKTQIKRKVSPFKEMTSLPNLEKIDPVLHPVINSSWQSYLFLKKSRQALDHSELQRYLNESTVDFHRSTTEKDLLKEKIVEMEKLMVTRMEKVSSQKEIKVY